GDVAAAQRAREAAVLAVEHAAVVGIAEPIALLPGDDALAAAPPQAGERVLAAHPEREPQAVADHRLDGRVRPVAEPAGRLSAHGRVDEGPEQRAGLGTDG